MVMSSGGASTRAGLAGSLPGPRKEATADRLERPSGLELTGARDHQGRHSTGSQTKLREAKTHDCGNGAKTP